MLSFLGVPSAYDGGAAGHQLHDLESARELYVYAEYFHFEFCGIALNSSIVDFIVCVCFHGLSSA